MGSFTVLDLDNCISRDDWRIPRIDWTKTDPDERYHNYHLLSAFDEVGNRHLFEGKEGIIILTARPIVYSALTLEWLLRAGVEPEYVGMRGSCDHRPSRELKEYQLRCAMAYLEISASDIECAYDDRADVIEVYRSMGVRGEVVSIHNVCSYTKPKEA